MNSPARNVVTAKASPVATARPRAAKGQAAHGAVDKLALVRQCPFFRGLDESVLRQLAEVSAVRRFAGGTMIYAKGDPPDGLFAVVRGRAKVSSIAANGKEMLFTILECGSWFGEVALFDGQTRSHDVYAMEPSEFLVVPPREFHEILRQQPHLYQHFLRLMCSYVRMSYCALEDQTFLSVPSRLAKRLITLADSFGVAVPEGVRINLHLPQERLAHMLGATRQSVSKELNAWVRKGWIELKYGRVLVRDRRALERVIDAPA